jgi:CopG family nickel-responsive transcriptional regulator
MRRLTISIDDELADSFDELVARKGYLNRSEAFRDLLRHTLDESAFDKSTRRPAGHCVATLSYVYDHHQRQLASRLTAMQHDHHDVTISSMHAHLDHDNCLETVLLRGATGAVQAFADAVLAQTGVRHGNLHMIPVQVHGIARRAARHVHLHPHS